MPRKLMPGHPMAGMFGYAADDEPDGCDKCGEPVDFMEDLCEKCKTERDKENDEE